MVRMISLAVVLAGLMLAGAADAQVTRSTPGQKEARTAIDLMAGVSKLTVTTPAFKDGGDIPFENTMYRGNVFPGLTWDIGPANTVSYVVIMQDNDLIVRGAPVLHWTLYNIPVSVTKLAPGMSEPPKGASYGPNYKGKAVAYTGPRTPPGPKDHYHFQVFALDTEVPAPVDNYLALTDAMKGHVLASGEVVGLGEKDPNYTPPAPAAAPAPATH